MTRVGFKVRFLWAIGYYGGHYPPPRWPPWDRFLHLIGYIREFPPKKERP